VPFSLELQALPLIAHPVILYNWCLYVSPEIIPTDDPNVAFKDVDVAILVGSMPRREGMLRKDLLKANAKIFETQGKALDQHAKKTVKVRQILSNY